VNVFHGIIDSLVSEQFFDSEQVAVRELGEHGSAPVAERRKVYGQKSLVLMLLCMPFSDFGENSRDAGVMYRGYSV